MKRVRGKGRGWVFTPKSFVDFGTRGSVDMALSRLVTAGDIRRIGRGLYDYPRQHDKLGALSPDPANVAKALSTQSGDKLAPSGAAAAHRLGLSTPVPARASYATTGPNRVRQHRQEVVEGKRGSVRVALGGRRIIKKKNNK